MQLVKVEVVLLGLLILRPVSETKSAPHGGFFHVVGVHHPRWPSSLNRGNFEFPQCAWAQPSCVGGNKSVADHKLQQCLHKVSALLLYGDFTD